MILIADSGSSKTDWRLIDGESISQFETIGLNPFVVSSKVIDETVRQLDLDFSSINKVFFYGAGCGNTEKANALKMVLKTIFITAEIDMKSDLLAVAHALLQNNSGVVGILGTGSNVAYYDGEIIKPVKTSLGYLLGDEGSGNHIGKQFLKLYLTDSLDADLDKEIKLDKDAILKELYGHSFPNRYLASFCKMLFTHRSHPQIAKIISDAFEEWIMVYLLPQNITKIHLCGSIAYYFSAELKACCYNHGITIESIVEKPISALTLYHIENQ